MPFNATVYKVMIASPSDVQRERSIVRDVIHEWNAVNAADRVTVLLPVAWETHSSPSMGARPQDVINRQVLADCDLLVAVFWTRIGTPTGEFPSGTVEEIEKHISQGKEAMIYFSSAPVRPESVDQQQYEALVVFRQRCKEMGLIEKYDTPSEFKDKFLRQLYSTMIRMCGSSPSEAVASIVERSRSEAVPILSREAKRLLMTAVKDPRRAILRTRTMSGVRVVSAGVEFVERGEPRSEARWEGAVDELADKDLIRDVGYEGEVYEVTARGFDVADTLTAVYG